MKTNLTLFAAALLLLPVTLGAQSPLQSIYPKYAADNRYLSVNLSKEMLQMFGNMTEEKDTAAAAFKRSVSRLNGLIALSCDMDTLRPGPALAFYSEVSALFRAPVYKELMRVTDKGSQLRFLTKTNARGEITELVMLERNKEQVMALSITGIIDLNTVAKISRTMEIQGMQELKNYRTQPKE